MFKRFLFQWALIGGVSVAAIGCGGGEPAIEDEAAPVTPIPSETTVDDAMSPAPTVTPAEGTPAGAPAPEAANPG